MRLRNWLLLISSALAVIFTICLFGWIVREDHRNALAEAEGTAVRTVTALKEHALKVLDTHELVLIEVNRLTRGRSWSEIEYDRNLWEYLVQIDAKLNQVRAINLIDADGRLRMTTTEFPAPFINVTDRDYFQAQRERDIGTYVSGPFIGTVTQERLISLSRRHASSDGSFDGVIQITVPLSYFTSFWQQFVPTVAHVIPLVRSDGLVIARFPAVNNPERLDINGPFLKRALAVPEGVYTAVSLVDGIERLNAYAQLNNYPLFISFSIETKAILAQRRGALLIYSIFTLLTITAVIVGAGLAFYQLRAYRATSRHWEETASELASAIRRREIAEQALVQAQKMEAMGQLTGGIAHDFNNILAAVMGSLELLAKRLPPNDSRAARLVENAIRGVHRGTGLTQRLLAFARKQELKPKPVSVSHLVLGMTDLIRNSLGPRVQLETRFSPGCPEALVDENQLELAILNLVVNARDAMSDAGIVTIEVDEESVGEGGSLPAGKYVLIRVIDVGSGMDEEMLRRATEPFFTTKAVGKGTGLGLSMVHGLTVQSGGQFTLKSKPGRGTTAELLVPTAEHKELSTTAALTHSDEKRLTDQLSVLVVDDDELVRTGTAGILEELGHTVIEARSGLEALQILQSGTSVNLIIADQIMPGMAGHELSSVIHERWPVLAVILVSGNAEFSGEPVEASIVRLDKPFGKKELAAAISEALPWAGEQKVVPLRRKS